MFLRVLEMTNEKRMIFQKLLKKVKRETIVITLHLKKITMIIIISVQL